MQLLNGRVEDDEISEEYCGLEGSTVQDQLTIVRSRLDQREAEYDELKTELNITKEECVNLQGNVPPKPVITICCLLIDVDIHPVSSCLSMFEKYNTVF